MEKNLIPLCLVVGFLGSGKTTFLKRIVRHYPDMQLAFIVNEFSSLDADGIAMQREHDKVFCLPGGSVFCRCLAGQFIQTLKELPHLLDMPHCDGVVVEASGIADPGVAPQMMREEGLDAIYRLSRIVAIVDPGNIGNLVEQLPNTRSQLQSADVILINKTDIYSEETLEEANAFIRTVNSTAAIEKTVFCQITLDLFGGKSCSNTLGTYAAGADPNFVTATAQTHAPVDVDRFLRAINTLQRELYRAKGFLKTETGAVYLDWTPSSHSCFELPGHNGPFGFSLIGPSNKAPAINALASRLQSGSFNKG